MFLINNIIRFFPLPKDLFKVIVWVYLRITKEKLLGQENKKKQFMSSLIMRNIHEYLIKICIALSLCFLVMYIAYHITSDPTSFGGEGLIKYIYYFILISHILLSITVIPFVLFSYIRAITGDFQRHRKIAKITFPIWLYVAVTGVIVYVMISPYYV